MRYEYKVCLLAVLAGILLTFLFSPPAFGGGNPGAEVNVSVDVDNSTHVDTDSRSTATSRSNSSAAGGKALARSGDVSVTTGGSSYEAGDSQVNLTSVDNSVWVAEDLKDQPGTPAAIVVDSCSSGASVSAPGYGASIGAGSRFCKLLALSNSYRADGDEAGAKWALEEARGVITREGRVTRFLHLDEIPLIGRLF